MRTIPKLFIQISIFLVLMAFPFSVHSVHARVLDFDRYFSKVDDGVYRGARPTTEEDFRKLKEEAGVKTIVDLESLFFNTHLGRKRAEEHGLNYRRFRLIPLFGKVSVTKVKQILRVMADPELRPVYVHCLRGVDRTSFVVGMYRIHVSGWSPEDARAEMAEIGFNEFLVPREDKFFNLHQTLGSLGEDFLAPFSESLSK